MRELHLVFYHSVILFLSLFHLKKLLFRPFSEILYMQVQDFLAAIQTLYIFIFRAVYANGPTPSKL